MLRGVAHQHRPCWQLRRPHHCQVRLTQREQTFPPCLGVTPVGPPAKWPYREAGRPLTAPVQPCSDGVAENARYTAPGEPVCLWETNLVQRIAPRPPASVLQRIHQGAYGECGGAGKRSSFFRKSVSWANVANHDPVRLDELTAWQAWSPCPSVGDAACKRLPRLRRTPNPRHSTTRDTSRQPITHRRGRHHLWRMW